MHVHSVKLGLSEVGGGGRTIYMPISTEGFRHADHVNKERLYGLGSRARRVFHALKGGGGGGGEEELFTCPYPLKVQACPSRDQRPALRSRVTGHDSEHNYRAQFYTSEKYIWILHTF